MLLPTARTVDSDYHVSQIQGFVPHFSPLIWIHITLFCILNITGNWNSTFWSFTSKVVRKRFTLGSLFVHYAWWSSQKHCSVVQHCCRPSSSLCQHKVQICPVLQKVRTQFESVLIWAFQYHLHLHFRKHSNQQKECLCLRFWSWNV